MSETQPTAEKMNAHAIDKNAIIKLLVAANPRRPNSKTFEIFNLYKDGMTVADFLTAGGRLVDVKADVLKKHIELCPPHKSHEHNTTEQPSAA